MAKRYKVNIKLGARLLSSRHMLKSNVTREETVEVLKNTLQLVETNAKNLTFRRLGNPPKEIKNATSDKPQIEEEKK